MGQKKVNEFECQSLKIGGSTFTSTSLAYVASIVSLTTSSTQLNFTTNNMYFEDGVFVGIGTATSTFVLST